MSSSATGGADTCRVTVVGPRGGWTSRCRPASRSPSCSRRSPTTPGSTRTRPGRRRRLGAAAARPGAVLPGSHPAAGGAARRRADLPAAARHNRPSLRSTTWPTSSHPVSATGPTRGAAGNLRTALAPRRWHGPAGRRRCCSSAALVRRRGGRGHSRGASARGGGSTVPGGGGHRRRRGTRLGRGGLRVPRRDTSASSGDPPRPLRCPGHAARRSAAAKQRGGEARSSMSRAPKRARGMAATGPSVPPRNA